MQPRASEGGGEWGWYLETCLCVCVCLDINNVVHVPATFIATSHGGRHARWQSAPKLSATLPPPSPAPTTAPGVQHSSVLAVFASIAANDILLAKVQNLPVHSCRSLAESERGGDYAYCPLLSTCPLATAHSAVLLATRTMPGWHYRSRLPLLLLLQVALLALGICNYSRLD